MAEYRINYTQSNFTGGIIAAELYGRNDFNKVKTGLKKCTNWTIREAGGLEFRRGTKYLQTIPVAAGTNFKMASLDSRLLFFCSDGIRYLDASNAWQKINYPTGISPNLSKLHFTELKQRLYYYDGTIKLCEVSLTGITPSTRITKFETEPSWFSISSAVSGNQPDVYVATKHEYAVSIAKDADHESIVFSTTTSQTANAELTQANSDTSDPDNPKGQEVDISVSTTVSVWNAHAGEKILIYKKYQGQFYFLDSFDIVASSLPSEHSITATVFRDRGLVSVDMSKTPKKRPSYLASDGSVAKVNSIADYSQRLFLTRSDQAVTEIIFSEVGNTDSLAYSAQRNEDEAGHLELPISNYDSWCKVVSGLDLILSTSYTISKVSGYGDLVTETILWDGLSKTVEPVRTRRSLIYTNASNRNIYDLTYNEYGQYDSIDLTLLIKYIFEEKTIKRLAFKDYPVKTIYVLCSDGELYCLTYIKDQNIYAWYKIEHSGTITDICVVNTDVEDEVYIVIKYDSTYVLERAYHRTDTVYLDCCIEKPLSQITDNVITGLDIFEGMKVRVFDLGNNLYYGDYDIMNPQTVVEGGKTVEIDDLDFDGYTVTRVSQPIYAWHHDDGGLTPSRYGTVYTFSDTPSVGDKLLDGIQEPILDTVAAVGSNTITVHDEVYTRDTTRDAAISGCGITLPDTIELTGTVLVGLPYYAVAETIPLEFSDQNGNSTIGRKKAVNEAYLRYGDSRGLTYKTMGHEYDCGICERDVADNAQFLERGQIKLHTVSEYKWDSTIKILQRQPYPARIESITLGITFNDKS